MKRLVLMVEGRGDELAATSLIYRLPKTIDGTVSFFVDSNVIKVGSLGKLCRDNFDFWKRMLGVARGRGNLGGVILLLDGDTPQFEGATFCAARAAKRLAEVARMTGAGQEFCTAVVFALCEYESWLIAGIHGAAGKMLPHDRGPVPHAIAAPEGNLEESPRDAKGWLDRHLPFGYRPTLDQAPLSRIVDLDAVRERMRSFKRFENAIRSLAEAIRTETPVVSP